MDEDREYHPISRDRNMTLSQSIWSEVSFGGIQGTSHQTTGVSSGQNSPTAVTDGSATRSPGRSDPKTSAPCQDEASSPHQHRNMEPAVAHTLLSTGIQVPQGACRSVGTVPKSSRIRATAQQAPVVSISDVEIKEASSPHTLLSTGIQVMQGSYRSVGTVPKSSRMLATAQQAPGVSTSDVESKEASSPHASFVSEAELATFISSAETRARRRSDLSREFTRELWSWIPVLEHIHFALNICSLIILIKK